MIWTGGGGGGGARVLELDDPAGGTPSLCFHVGAPAEALATGGGAAAAASSLFGGRSD
jgi:hypothetical protein